MFARPRPKKNILHAPSKKRKNAHAIEEISYDPEARSDYLTGFHKRKVQRQKIAQEQAAKQARQEKVDARREVSYGFYFRIDISKFYDLINANTMDSIARVADKK